MTFQASILHRPEFAYSQTHIFLGSQPLEIAAYIERTAINMRIDTIRTLRVSLAGTATSKFTDVIEAVFGVDEEVAPN